MKLHAMARELSPGNLDKARFVCRSSWLGYLAADLKRNPVGYFLHPVFAAHSREEFEIVAYSSVENRDDLTDRFITHADQWRDVADVDDEALAAIVSEDRIDILEAMSRKGL